MNCGKVLIVAAAILLAASGRQTVHAQPAPVPATPPALARPVPAPLAPAQTTPVQAAPAQPAGMPDQAYILGPGTWCK
jgi:hypothetical protein